VKKSLGPHLKSHKIGRKKWTKALYQEKFPEFSLGQPNFSPSPEQQKKFFEGRDKRIENKQAEKESLNKSPMKASDGRKISGDTKVEAAGYESQIVERFEELWDQVNRDIPARQFAMEAARAEFRIEEINRRFDSAFVRGAYDQTAKLMPQLIQQQEILKKQMDFLDLTVKNRREKNQLGNDTVAQLISNFAGTLRRMPPEKREAFGNRIKEVRRTMGERIRQKLLSEVLDERIDEIVKVKEMTEKDYDDKIQSFIDRSVD
jgi:hypothetical protein